MPHSGRPRWASHSGLKALALLVAVGGSCAFTKLRAATDPPEGRRESRSTDAVAQSAGKADIRGDATRASEGSRRWDDLHRVSRSLGSRRPSQIDGALGSDGWYLGMAGVAVVLAIGGGVAAAARRYAPRTGAGALQVVSRVSLSPKHTVYLMRAGGRVLLVGTGPQGAPSLISELDEIPQILAAPGQGDAA
jgi:hypothetical protein